MNVSLLTLVIRFPWKCSGRQPHLACPETLNKWEGLDGYLCFNRMAEITELWGNKADGGDPSVASSTEDEEKRN